MSKKKRQRVAVGTEESAMAAKADQLLNQGKVDFESVYGPKIAGSFNAQAEMNLTNEVHMSNNKPKTRISTNKTAPVATAPAAVEPMVAPTADATVSAGFSMPEATTEMPKIPVTNLGPDNVEPEAKKEVEEKELTIEEKCEELSKFVKKVTDYVVPIQTLLNWKQMHGDLFMLHMGERVFLFRYLKRQEWAQMKANPQFDEMTELQREEDIYNRCLLFPKVDAIKQAGDAANIMGMIAEQVKLQSFFLDEMYVAQMVIKI